MTEIMGTFPRESSKEEFCWHLKPVTRVDSVLMKSFHSRICCVKLPEASLSWTDQDQPSSSAKSHLVFQAKAAMLILLLLSLIFTEGKVVLKSAESDFLPDDDVTQQPHKPHKRIAAEDDDGHKVEI